MKTIRETKGLKQLRRLEFGKFFSSDFFFDFWRILVSKKKLKNSFLRFEALSLEKFFQLALIDFLLKQFTVDFFWQSFPTKNIDLKFSEKFRILTTQN